MLPKKFQTHIDERLGRSELLRWGTEVVNLQEWSRSYQQSFKTAWKAIERNSLKKLKDSIKNMKEHATDKEKYLDVCRLQFCMSLRKRINTFYFMTLLSYAAVHGRKSMVEELLDSGAHVEAGSGVTGSPLTQVLEYAQHHNCPEVIDGEIVQLLVNEPLDVLVIYCLTETPDDKIKVRSKACSPIELAVSIKRIDIAQQLVMAGANPINPSTVCLGVPQLLYEYYEFGTNEYISWLLDHHLLSQQLPKFIKDVVKLDVLSEKCRKMFNSVGRHPAHALLTCGNEDLIREFLESRKCPHVEGQNAQPQTPGCACKRLLTVTDVTERTALQIAAQKGDFESVATLLNFYGKSHKDKQDRALGLLAAARRGDVRIVGHFLKEDTQTVLEELPNKGSVLDFAVKEGLTCLFEVLRDYPYIYKTFTSSSNNDGNTLVHEAALAGNSRLFKVFFPLEPMRMSQVGQIQRAAKDQADIQGKISSGHAKKMFEALTLMNRGKTPLHLAIDHDQLCILRTLQERFVERDSLPGAEQNKEMNAWKVFWEEWGPKLFIYACSGGSVDAVKFFIEMDTSFDGENPLSAAAREGKDDTLQYLLSECKYSMPTLPEHSPLLLAAERGHAGCVSILLKHGADVRQKPSKYHGYNCLMVAIERKFKSTVMAILSDEQGIEALRCRQGSVTPMGMLIEYLPDVAEWVLNKCLIEGHKLRPPRMALKRELPTDNKAADISEGVGGLQGDKDIAKGTEAIPEAEASFASGGNIDEPSPHSMSKSSSTEPLLHEFEFFEAFQSPKKGQDKTDSGEAGRDCQQKSHSSNDIILLMIRYNRKKLLDHFLVGRLISYKWWKVGLPFLLTSYIFHLLFLITLTAFALVIPRPGQTCPRVVMVPVSNINENMTDEELTTEQGNDNENDPDIRSCEDAGITEGQTLFLTTSAAILIIACLIYLTVRVMVKVYQLYRRPQFRAVLGHRHISQQKRKLLKYLHHHYRAVLKEIHSVVLYMCVIIFVFPFGHECWCFPMWKWQIGALAIFMAWINNFILLKDIPHFGKPITMLFNVYMNFILLIYLPILLILTFAFPFYMLFIATLEGTTVEYFPTPFHAMWDVLLQAADGPDSQFFTATLSHRVMTYILFITFIVAVPVLFSNFLVGEAVGEADAERKKAKLSIIQAKVGYIQECEQTVPFFGRKFSYESKPPDPKPDQRFLEVLEQQNRAFLEEFELEGDVQKRKLEKLQTNMLEATKQFEVLEVKLNSVEKIIAQQTATIEKLRSVIEGKSELD